MSAIAKIMYLGADSLFYQRLESLELSDKSTQIELVENDLESSRFLDFFLEVEPDLVFFDLGSFQDLDGAVAEVNYIKNLPRYRSVLFVAVQDSNISYTDQLYLYSSGFQFGFYKGGELEGFFEDCLFIGLMNEISFVEFARAKNINNTLNIGFVSSLSEVENESFVVETDIETSNEKIDLSLDLFPDLTCESFEVIDRDDEGCHFTMTDRYRVKFPIAGPWDDISEETIQEETIETWIENNQKVLARKVGKVLIISSDTKVILDTFDYGSSSKFIINIIDVDKEISRNQYFKRNKPQIIFIDLSSDNTGDITDTINHINNTRDYDPILIILNSPSKTASFQKLFGYSNIISGSQKLSLDILKSFLDHFLSNSEHLKEVQFFKPTAKLRSLNVYEDVNVLTLTEHEITFESELKIPLYTVLSLKLPVECFVTVVPSLYDLPGGKLNQYMGIIHSISEGNIETLRKFINQIIYEPIKEFTESAIFDVLSQKEEDKQEFTPDTNEDKSVKVEIKIKKEKAFVRPITNEKSKL
jgi:hypothetical protein